MDSASDIALALAHRAEAVCRAYLPNGHRAGHYWQIGDVTGVRGASLAVRLVDSPGRRAGKWTDYATGEHGDLLDLIAHAMGTAMFADVLREARAFLGCPDIGRIEAPAVGATPASASGVERARRLFAIGKPIAGTPAEAYLRNRDITRFGPALAYHDAVHYRAFKSGALKAGPALLARITDGIGALTGVARTWLDIERRTVIDIAAPKRVTGQLLGHAVRFGTADAPGATRNDILAVGEGIETMLSIGSALPSLPLAACLTATHLGLFDVPERLHELWIVKDNDEAGERAARILRQRLTGRDLIIRELEPVLGDFNDDLFHWGVDSMRDRLCSELGSVAVRLVEGSAPGAASAS